MPVQSQRRGGTAGPRTDDQYPASGEPPSPGDHNSPPASPVWANNDSGAVSVTPSITAK